MKASENCNKSEDIKIALLLHIIGDPGLDIYNTFPVHETTTLDDVLAAFDQYFLPKRNITMESFKFNNLTQQEDQNIDSFITQLKKQASFCNFVCEKPECKQSYADRMIRDRVLLGLIEKQIQQRLIREPDMTLVKIQEYIKSIEVSQQHIQMLSSQEQEVNIVKVKFKCTRCGYEHQRGQCPAYNKTCNNCQRKNHFTKMCGSKQFNNKLNGDANSFSQPEQQISNSKEDMEVELITLLVAVAVIRTIKGWRVKCRR